MPLTPLHLPIVYLIYKIDKRFSLPGLIVGSMFPDLEIPFIVFFFGTQVPNRMILHSILGSATIGTFLALIVTVRVYPIFVNLLFNIDMKKIQKKCRFSFVVAASVFIGILSHVLLDVLNHPYNPIFWPFRSAIETPSNIYFVLGDPLGSWWLQIVMGIFLLGIAFINRKNLFEKVLVG